MPTEGVTLLPRLVLMAGPSLVTTWLNSQRPHVAQTIGGGFTKLQTLIYFPKVLAWAASTSLASGCIQGSQLSLPRSRRGCLTVEMGAVFPPGAMGGSAPVQRQPG